MDVFDELSITIDEAKELKKDSNAFQNFCFQVSHICNGDEGKLIEISKLLDVSCDDIVSGAQAFHDEECNHRKIIKSRLEREEKENLRRQEMVHELLKVKKIEELKNLFEKYQITKDTLGTITETVITMYPKGYAKKVEKIKKIFDMYEHYEEEIEEKKNSIKNSINQEKLRKLALLVADEVLSRDDIYTIEGISDSLQIEKRLFNKYLKVLKEEKVNEITIYDRIVDKIQKNLHQYDSIKYKGLIDKLLIIIDKPIKVGSNYRLFDLLDCITYFGNDLGEIYDAITIIYEDEKSKSREIAHKIELLEKTMNYYQFEIFKIIDSKPSSSDKLDDVQKQVYKTILGSEINAPYADDFDRKIVTHIEKEDILRLMKKNNIPISVFYFNLALKRYNEGNLEFITQDNIDIYIKDSKKETN